MSMKRFNRAVQAADDYLGNGADRLDVPELIKALDHAAWSKPSGVLSRELFTAAVEVGYNFPVNRGE